MGKPLSFYVGRKPLSFPVKKFIVVLWLLIAMTLLPYEATWATEAAEAGPYPILKNPIVTDVDVLIDVGHGGVDPGTFYGEIYEKNINLDISMLTYKILRNKGVNVLVNRVGDYALSGENRWFRSNSRHLKDLAQRSHLANEIRPKAVVSLHVNWAAKEGRHGPIVLHQKSVASKRLANCMQASLNRLYGTDHTVIYGKTFYLLNHVHVPAIIVEMGFLSNASDRAQMTEPKKQQQLAEAIANGIIAYLKAEPHPAK